MSLAIAIFVLAYVLIASEKISRIAIALGGAAAMLIIGATDSDKAFYSHETGIDWDVIFLLLGMMIIVGVIHKTGVFEFLFFSWIFSKNGFATSGKFSAEEINLAMAFGFLSSI